MPSVDRRPFWLTFSSLVSVVLQTKTFLLLQEKLYNTLLIIQLLQPSNGTIFFVQYSCGKCPWWPRWPLLRGFHCTPGVTIVGTEVKLTELVRFYDDGSAVLVFVICIGSHLCAVSEKKTQVLNCPMHVLTRSMAVIPLTLHVYIPVYLVLAIHVGILYCDIKIIKPTKIKHVALT